MVKSTQVGGPVGGPQRRRVVASSKRPTGEMAVLPSPQPPLTQAEIIPAPQPRGKKRRPTKNVLAARKAFVDAFARRARQLDALS